MGILDNLINTEGINHHAYLLIGDKASVLLDLKNSLSKKFGDDFVSSNNPDFLIQDLVVWGVNDSRRLKEIQSLRPVSWDKRIVVIVSTEMTAEAQNSLLKMLEEPSVDNLFFLLAPHYDYFLPTVVSRCQTINVSSALLNQDMSNLAKEFLIGTVDKRLLLARELLAKQVLDEISGPQLINTLWIMWSELSVNLNENKRLIGGQAFSWAFKLANERGSSLRLILEYLSLVVPTH